jgi:hypothetical protein
LARTAAHNIRHNGFSVIGKNLGIVGPEEAVGKQLTLGSNFKHLAEDSSLSLLFPSAALFFSLLVVLGQQSL